MSDFDLRQLRYFVETAAAGSMSQAAKRLFVSQQALSKGITALEAQLGAPLFVRGRGGVELTPFGAFFLKRAKMSLQVLDFAGDSLRDFSSGAVRTVSLGMPSNCLSDFGGTLSAPKLYELQRAFPRVTFEFEEVDTPEMCHRLEEGALQFGIGDGLDELAYERRLLGRFRIVAIVSNENPLSRGARVRPEDLAGGYVALSPGDEGTRRLLSRLGDQAGVRIPFSPIRIMSVDNAELVVSPDTFVVRPEQHARRTTSTDRVSLVPLVDATGEDVFVSLFLNWRRGLPLGDAERALVRYIVGLYERRGDA